MAPPSVETSPPPVAPIRAPAASRRAGPVVVLADADVAAGKAMTQVLADWDCEPVLVHDGVEAILSIQRLLPAVAVLDAALPKMFGFQVCELMKRNESLRRIHVVLVGAVHHQDRNRREPDERYGADAYVERPQLPEALRPILRGFGIDVGAAPADSPPAALVPEVPFTPPPRSRAPCKTRSPWRSSTTTATG